MSHAERIAQARPANTPSLSTVEKLRKHIVGTAGTLFSQTPEIRGLQYRDGIHDISHHAKRFHETLESPHFLRGFWMASSDILGHLSTVMTGVDNHPALFTSQFREDISDIRTRFETLVQQYDMAVAVGMLPALAQIDQKEARATSNRKPGKAERLRQSYVTPLDKDTFAANRALYVEPLFNTLEELKAAFDGLATRTHGGNDPSADLSQRLSHDRAIANHLRTTTDAIDRVLHHADKLIQHHFAREQAAPAR